jgi:hypothetical protein
VLTDARDLEVENAELRAENARLRAKLADAVDYEAYANGHRPMNRYEKLFAANAQQVRDARRHGYGAHDLQNPMVRGQIGDHIASQLWHDAVVSQRSWNDGVLCGRTPKDDHGEGEG